MARKFQDEVLSLIPPDRLRPWARNARKHLKKQLRQIADSIHECGFTNPVLIDEDLTILAGHGRVEAAKLLGLVSVPCRLLSEMTEAQKRAYVLADNKLAPNAGWDDELLAEELGAVQDLSFDVSLTGFSIPEIDALVDGWRRRSRATRPTTRRRRMGRGAAGRGTSGCSASTGWSAGMRWTRRSCPC